MTSVYTIVPCDNPAGWYSVLRDAKPLWHWAGKDCAEQFVALIQAGTPPKEAAAKIQSDE